MGRLFIFTSLLVILAIIFGGFSQIAQASSNAVNVDVSQRHFNESEETIAVNPTNPNNIVIITNIGHVEAGLTAGLFKAVSFDGGLTWTKQIIGNNDALGSGPVIMMNTVGGLRRTSQVRLELMKTLHASDWQTFIKVKFPSALPSISTGPVRSRSRHHMAPSSMCVPQFVIMPSQ